MVTSVLSRVLSSRRSRAHREALFNCVAYGVVAGPLFYLAWYVINLIFAFVLLPDALFSKIPQGAIRSAHPITYSFFYVIEGAFLATFMLLVATIYRRTLRRYTRRNVRVDSR